MVGNKFLSNFYKDKVIASITTEMGDRGAFAAAILIKFTDGHELRVSAQHHQFGFDASTPCLSFQVS